MGNTLYRKDDGVEVEVEDLYDDMLDEVYGYVEIAGCSYPTSTALYKLDRIAYDVGMSDYDSALLDDGEYVETYQETDVYEEDDEDDDCCECSESYRNRGEHTPGCPMDDGERGEADDED